MRTVTLRLVAGAIAGAAALLTVAPLRAQIEDLTELCSATPADLAYRRLAASAAAACGELGAERESCEMSLMRLAPFAAAGVTPSAAARTAP